MMKTAQNRNGGDAVALANPMATRHRHGVWALRNARSQARMWTPAIVMRDPLSENLSKVTLVQRNHPIQALPPNRANHPLAKRVRLWRSFFSTLKT